MTRQYLSIAFRDGAREYTYHNDGEPVAKGDKVKLPGRKPDDGWQRGTVTKVLEDKPADLKFETKAILGKLDEPEPSAAPAGGEQPPVSASPSYEGQPPVSAAEGGVEVPAPVGEDG